MPYFLHYGKSDTIFCKKNFVVTLEKYPGNAGKVFSISLFAYSLVCSLLLFLMKNFYKHTILQSHLLLHEHNTQPFQCDAKEGFQRVQIERELLWKVLGLVSGEICAVRLFKFVILNIQIKTFQISCTTR